jgi:hypothetical protein
MAMEGDGLPKFSLAGVANAVHTIQSNLLHNQVVPSGVTAHGAQREIIFLPQYTSGEILCTIHLFFCTAEQCFSFAFIVVHVRRLHT